MQIRFSGLGFMFIGALFAAQGFAQTRPRMPQPLRPFPVAPWAFADIRVNVMGPNTIKIERAPLTGADQYRSTAVM
jgi:hypothetical protein